jgi:hypothetical protein
MFCPQCGLSQTDDLKFCKTCGANLHAVRQVVATRETGESFDWGKTWVAEMFLSEAERKKRARLLERQQGITAEVKRYTEIKAGVIVSFIGVALMIFLNFLMQGVINSGQSPASDAAILSRIWVAGIFPFFVGMGLLVNGVIVSRKLVELEKRNSRSGLNVLDQQQEPSALPSADTSEFIPTQLSVTEGTTRHLSKASQKKSSNPGSVRTAGKRKNGPPPTPFHARDDSGI